MKKTIKITTKDKEYYNRDVQSRDSAFVWLDGELREDSNHAKCVEKLANVRIDIFGSLSDRASMVKDKGIEYKGMFMGHKLKALTKYITEYDDILKEYDILCKDTLIVIENTIEGISKKDIESILNEYYGGYRVVFE